jgi:hypothetical protein
MEDASPSAPLPGSGSWDSIDASGVAGAVSMGGWPAGISFDGVREAQDVRSPGSFDLLEGVVERFSTNHPTFFAQRVTVGITIWSGNISFLHRSVEMLIARGVRSIAVNPLITPDPGWSEATIEELDRQFARIETTCRDHLRRTGEIPVGLLRRTTSAPSVFGQCGATDGSKLCVDVDGALFPCAGLAESYQEFPPGLLSDPGRRCQLGSITDFDTTDRLAAGPHLIRQTGLFDNLEHRYSTYGRCVTCRYVESCAVCPISTAHVPGNTDPNRVPDHQCAFNLVTNHYRSSFPPLPSPAVGCANELPTPEQLGDSMRRAFGLVREP